MSRSRRLLFLSLLFFFLVLSVSAHGGSHDDGGGGDDDAGTPDEGKHDLRSRTLILAKIWCLIIIFFATFLAGVSPYVLKWNEDFLVLGTQFAGGVFLGTAMMHFLSDANEKFQDLTEKEYPFAFMLACAGYLITMLADCTISTVFVTNNSGSGYRVDVEGDQSGKANDHSVISQSQLQAPNGSNAHLANSALASTSSVGDTILLIIALCFHSVFEGIAIGVAENKDDAYKALWTISLHKVFAAIAMGIALLRMIPNRPLLSCAAYSFAFAISSPIGVAIGIIIGATTQGHVADWIFAISMGLACGVFIFVSINHLLAKGYIPQKPVKFDRVFPKFLAVLLGVGVIAVVMIWDT